MMDQLIFTDEAAIAGVPIPYLTLNTVGPTIMRFGTDAQKTEILPKILKGEMHFSIGYSEPESGTDLASLKTRARLEGDEWVINGQKMWTSLIQYADYIWLACRTDPDLPRHKGLSMILVPADSEGFSYTPVHTVAGVGTSATYYEDVRVPKDNLVGELNGGWALMTNQLNHERVALTSAAPVTHSIKLVTEWAQQTRNPDGSRVIDSEWVQVLLGRAHARADMLKLLNWQLASATKDLSPADASATKVYGSEMATEVYRSLMEVVGPKALVSADSCGHRPARPARALLPVLAGDDLRRRHQRDPARHHRVRRPRPAARREKRQAIGLTWTSSRPPRGPRQPSWPASSSRSTARAERLRRSRQVPARFDHELWRRFADSGLIALTVPEEHDGSGLGILELAQRADRGRPQGGPAPPGHARRDRDGPGRVREPDPAGAVAARRRAGRVPPDHGPLRGPAVRPRPPRHARRQRRVQWLLTGSKAVVPSGPLADLFVVPAETSSGLTVFLVHCDDPGVVVVPQQLSGHEVAARLELDRAAVPLDRVLGNIGEGAEIVEWLLERLTVAVCAEQLGVLEGALALTSEYAKTREQFGRPIGTFQAVSQRLADGYIDVLGARLTMWQAAWRLSEGLPATQEIAVAKLWAADAGHRLAHTTVHVHGGVGIDLDGEAHRYFTAAKRLEFALGGTTDQARVIGRLLAAEPA